MAHNVNAPAGQPKTILLVEDEALIALTESNLLRKEGYEVITVHSGRQAIKAAREAPERIDLILMDIDLGRGMDGTEAAREILKEREVPILFLSAYTEEDIVARTEQITSYGYVVKNSGDDVLLTSIKMAFRLHEATRALRLSEEKYSKAFQLTPDSMSISRLADGLILAVNRGFTEIMGYTPDEVVGKSSLPPGIGIWVHERDRRRLVEELTRHEEVRDMEAEFRRKDGSVHLGVVSARVFETQSERCIITVTRDITEPRKARDELRWKSALSNAVVNSSLDGILVVNGEGKKILQNQRLIDLWKIPQQIAGQDDDEKQVKWIMNMTKNPEQFVEKIVYLYSHPGEASRDEIELTDGTVLDRYSCPVIGEQGEQYGRTWTFRDVTDRKRMEETLERSVSTLHASLESTADGILVVDRKGVIINFNRKFVDMWGIPQEVLDSHSDERALRYILGQLKDSEAFLSKVQELYGQPELESLDTLEFVDGRVFERYSIPQKIGGRYVGRVWSFRDITRRREVELSLKASLKEKEVLLQEVHHRVKNNLNTVASLLSLQARYAKVSEDAALFQEAQNRVIAMARIHEELYKSKTLGSLDFRSYLRNIIAGLAGIFGRPEVGVALDVDPVDLSPDRAIPLGLIINEMVTNCYKYAFPGGRQGEISVSMTQDEDGLLLRVGDSGIGLPAGVELNNPATLGMNLITLLTQQLGGTLTIGKGPGAEFTIRLPREG